MDRKNVWLAGAFCMMTASGCASVSSARLADGGSRDMSKRQGGLVYYLPMQKFELTLTVIQKEAEKKDVAKEGDRKQAKAGSDALVPASGSISADVSLKATPMMADTSRAYVAQFRRNHAGINKMIVRASANGLLDGNFAGSTTSQLSETLKALAATAAEARISFLNPSLGSCSEPGVYKWVFGATLSKDVESSLASCGLTVDVDALSAAATTTAPSSQPVWKGNWSEHWPGFFYRQRLPFVVSVKQGNKTYKFYEAIAGDHSPVEFMPIPRAIFATVNWKIDFEDGVPKMYDIDASGDYLGLFKLPADVISAYSDAIVSGFDQDKAVAKSEQDFLDQAAKLAASQAKYEACRTAAQGGDPEKIKAACN